MQKVNFLQLTIFGTAGHFPLEKSATNHTLIVSKHFKRRKKHY